MLGINAVWLGPPQYSLQKATALSSRAASRPPGAVLGYVIPATTLDFGDAVGAFMQYRSAWTARVVIAEQSRDIALWNGLLPLLEPYCIDSVLLSNELSRSALASMLAQRPPTVTRIVARLRFHGMAIDSAGVRVLSQVLGPYDGQRFRRSLSQAGFSLRTAERHMKACALPTPRAWRHFARAVRAVALLQGDPGISVERAALESGFAAETSLCRAVRAVFGTSPRQAAAEIAWQPLLGEFLSRHGVAALE